MESHRVQITTEYIELQALLKFEGIAPTGGAAKELIQSGQVTLNGETCPQRGRKIRPGDVVCIAGQIELVVV